MASENEQRPAELTEEEIARVIRETENGGRYIHGMMPEAAARAIVELIQSRLEPKP